MTFRMDATDEMMAALCAHQRPEQYRCTIIALNDAGKPCPDVPAVLLHDTRRLAGDTHLLAETIVRDGHDPDVAGFAFVWRHDGGPHGMPVVSVVSVDRAGVAAETEYLTHPVTGLFRCVGWSDSSVFARLCSIATGTAFRFNHGTLGLVQ